MAKMLHTLFQKQMYQLLIPFLIRLISHRQVNPGLLVYNTLIMGKCIKSVFSVVSSHSARTESAESHLVGCKVDDRIVDTSAAVTAAGSYSSCRGLVIGKDIERQRMRHGVDIADRFVQRIVGEDRHYRSEDLLLHHSVSEGGVVNDGRFDFKGAPVRFAAPGCFILVDQVHDPVKMLLINDLAIIIAV